MRLTFGISRLLAAVVGILALVAHLQYSLGSGGSALANFFSYFTMQSAIAAVVLWSIGGAVALRAPVDPRWLVTGRLLVTTYQIVSGVVYTIIVAEALSHQVPIHIPASTQVLHYWLPAFALVDWLFAPGRGRVHWRVLSVVLVFPLTWGAFTMVRGAEVGWYPYFFLDPYQVSGLAEFASYGAAALTFVLIIAAALIGCTLATPRERRSEWLPGEERFEASPGTVDELAVVQLGERDGAFSADDAYQNR